MLKKQKLVEQWEYHYFNEIIFILAQDLEKMIKGLNSKNEIEKDWKKIFDKTKKNSQTSDFARGAERIYFWLFNQFGKPNSTPIGSDLMFETYNAFIHIDIKTCKNDNPSDYKSIPVGENQTSYSSKDLKANLPFFYSKDNKYCLTYILSIVYNEKDLNIESIALICIPNGYLKNIYNDDIIGQGKNKNRSFRFKYKDKKSCFSLIEGKPKRFKYIFPENS